MPKYMVKKPPSGISVVILAEALTSHLFKITANEKQFPKAYRYTLVSQIRNTCLDLNRHIYNGCVKKGAVPKDSDGFMVLMKRKKSKREAWEDDVRERVKSDPVKYANLNLKAMLSINDLIEKTPHRISKRTKAKRKLRTAQASLIDPSTTKL